jgi:translation initiation factor IF-2
MGVRLNKVLSELNIGLQTAVDFLKKKSELGDIKDDATPNTKISDEQYEALVGEFNGDKAVKTKADMLFPKKPKEKKVEKKPAPAAEELLEKGPLPQFKTVGKIDLDTVGKAKPTPKPEPVAAAEPEKPEPEPVKEEVPAEEPAQPVVTEP